MPPRRDPNERDDLAADDKLVEVITGGETITK